RAQQGGLGVEHLGQPALGQARPEVAQLAEGGGVEGLGLDPGEPEGGQALAHLVGRLVGASDHQDRAGGKGGAWPRGHPGAARRSRISLAALSVKVPTSRWLGWTAPGAIAYATR